MATLYDEVLYPGFAMPHAHPDRLAAHAVIFGMDPAPVARCRVLELGCGDGGHLIPIAAAYPESQFTGVDLAAAGIEAAADYITKFGLRNIRFHQMDVMD